jgi:phosphomethylpyrimidine synthase
MQRLLPPAVLADMLDARAEDMARAESLDASDIRAGVEAGTMVVLANPAHPDVLPTLVGRPSSIKVNANIGTSPMTEENSGTGAEDEKLAMAVRAGAHTVMDLSTAGDLDAIRLGLLQGASLPLGTVPVYSAAKAALDAGRDVADLTADDLLAEIDKQARQGVDFMTVHCGVTRRAAGLATDGTRVLGIVSRGGSMLARWMKVNQAENPLLERFDDILAIAAARNVTLSLGDGLRPGAGADAGDAAQMEEVVVLGELTLRAWKAGVQVMIEGPGHVPLDQVPAQIQAIKRLTHNAPLYVLGPLTTDAAPGFDHIGAAIGGAVAAMNGADFLCYVTPAEHLTLPCAEDVYSGVMASRVAAMSAETALGRPAAVARDLEISRARSELDWEKITALALDPALVKARRGQHGSEKECAMCGRFCAIRMLGEV